MIFILLLPISKTEFNFKQWLQKHIMSKEEEAIEKSVQENKKLFFKTRNVKNKKWTSEN